MPYVIRPRPLPAHLHTDWLHTVYDVTEPGTTKPVPFGVHTSPGRALAHRDWLGKQAAAAREVEEREAEEELAKVRARVKARDRQEAEQAAETKETKTP
ncbi:hypothetical protein [Nocardiopsis sp. FR26]|uniref:hypothetical protein n=1 Tax=Nocardiopsis sp. FR26 TaxID=2605987 RepID=UPI001359DBF1|nr:hypothetical protein [Nocardiopsis sp. FR26]